MNIFISGGAKNGKSYYAQKRARIMADEKNCPLYYVATMIPHDEEDHARIRRHIKERDGWGFDTLEQGRALPALLEDETVDRNGVFLLDSVTAILSNEMFDDEGTFDSEAAERVKRDVLRFARETGNTVFVSDCIYGDAGDYDELTEEYRRGLAMIDRALAGYCDEVIEISCGIEEKWK